MSSRRRRRSSKRSGFFGINPTVEYWSIYEDYHNDNEINYYYHIEGNHVDRYYIMQRIHYNVHSASPAVVGGEKITVTRIPTEWDDIEMLFSYAT